MFSNSMFGQALRLLSGACLALSLAFALAILHRRMVGGSVPPAVIGVFLCMSCQALLPAVAFALWDLFPARRPASRSWRGGMPDGRLVSRLGYAPDGAPSRLS